jgi:hypothetical protein
MVYLGYVYDEMSYCPELVGVFATKPAAYRAVRKRIKEMIIEHWECWAGGRYRHDYHFTWRIKPVEPAT